MNQLEIEPELIAETETFSVLRSREEDDTYYHIGLGSLTLHLTSEEWAELVTLIQDANSYNDK